MKTRLFLAIAIGALTSVSLSGQGEESTATPANTSGETATNAPMFQKLADAKWNKILPDLGANSPEICILHVDPKTQATSLLIRTSKAIHIRKHWHTANESHTIITGTVGFACDGQRVELGPGSFNFMPAKMVHEAWLPANSLTFITVDSAWDVNWVEGPPTSADLSRAF